MLTEDRLWAKVLLSIDLAWRTGDLSYKLHAGQDVIHKTFHNSQADEMLLLCARRFGKSFALCVLAIEECIKHPGICIRYAAPTLKQCNEIVTDCIEQIIVDAPKGLVKKNRTQYNWRIGESQIKLGMLERAHVDSLRGGRDADLVIVDEGGSVRSDDYRYAVRSALAPQVMRTNGKIVHATTPSETEFDHYVHTELLPKCRLNGTSFEFTIYDNPQITIEDIDKQARLMGGKESVAFRVNCLVQIIRNEDVTCIPEFDETIHVQDFEPPQYANWLTSTDLGGVRDKTVSLLCYYDLITAKTYVLDERVHGNNTDTETIHRDLLALEAERPIGKRVMDAPGQLIVDLHRKHSYPAIAPNKDDWQAGLNAVRLAFNASALIVHSRCRFLVETLKAATFNKNKTDFNRTETLGHMDALAALQYAVRMVDKTTNPWPAIPRDREKYFYTKPPDEPVNSKVARAMQPKSFMSGKRRF